jgi:fumarate reductase subunit D
MAVLEAYLGFMVIVIITLISMALLGTRTDSTSESILGAAMLIIAAYFFLSVIMMPQFGDMGEIYRLATYQGEKQIVSPQDALFLCFTMAALFTTGFLAMRRKIRKEKKWTSAPF